MSQRSSLVTAVQVFAGELDGTRSPAPTYSPLLGADVHVHPRHELQLPLCPGYEHALLVMEGGCAVDGEPLATGMLYYLGTARSEIGFTSRSGRRVLLIGGPPFPETILMWWNFVARTPEEIAEARAVTRRSAAVSAAPWPECLAAASAARFAGSA